MHLSLYNDRTGSDTLAGQLISKSLVSGLKALDSRVRRKGLEALDPAKSDLVRIGTEVDEAGRVTKNSYGVFNLAWQAESHPEWPAEVEKEVEEIRAGVRAAHGKHLRFAIWAGMGGSVEDKTAYNAAGLLKKGPRVYSLDSTDPAKLKAILYDMTTRSKLPLADALKSTLVVGQALGMTSYEPVVNMEKLWNLYQKNRIDGRANFIYMTLTGSTLDQFAGPRGFRRVPLQLDGGNSTSGRHSSPMTRGSLYAVALAKGDLKAWMEGASFTDGEVDEAFRLSAFLHSNGVAGRDKATLMLSKSFTGFEVWTKQDCEESLGKSEALGLKIVINEAIKPANYHAPKDSAQDRVFLLVQRKGEKSPESEKAALLRRAGYPTAVLTLPADAPHSRYMQFLHYVVFGLGYLRQMNFITQPSVELYKAITGRIHFNGAVGQAEEFARLKASTKQAKWRGGVTLHYDRVAVEAEGADAAELYASILRKLAAGRAIEYGEITFFGDSRYSESGRALRKTLERAGAAIFPAALKMPVDVGEGPGMNHSYHEMIIGHGKCFSTVLISEKSEKIAAADYNAEYHRAQWLATQMALAERGRNVAAIVLKDLEEPTITALGEFFRAVASALKRRR